MSGNPRVHAHNSGDDPASTDANGAVSPKQCQSYRGGHTLHVARAMASWKAPYVPVDIRSIDGHLVRFATPDGEETWWHHDPERLLAMSDITTLIPTAFAEWCPKYRVLQVTYGGRVLSLPVEQGDGSPCSATPVDGAYFRL